MNKRLSKIICMAVLLSLFTSVFSLKAEAADTTKAKYEMFEDKITVKDIKDREWGIISFQYPHLKGSSSAIKKINKILEKECKEFMESESSLLIQDYANQAIISNGNKENVDINTYFYTTTCEVTYNQKSVLSLHMTTGWYAGGVYNQYDYGYTFNLKTGKQMAITDVVSGNKKAIKKSILTAAKKYLTVDGQLDENAYKIIESMELSDFKFFVSKGKVNLCFGSYELERGNSIDLFSIKGKYN